MLTTEVGGIRKYILRHCSQIHHHVAIIAMTLAQSSHPKLSFLIIKTTKTEWPIIWHLSILKPESNKLQRHLLELLFSFHMPQITKSLRTPINMFRKNKCWKVHKHAHNWYPLSFKVHEWIMPQNENYKLISKKFILFWFGAQRNWITQEMIDRFAWKLC